MAISFEQIPGDGPTRRQSHLPKDQIGVKGDAMDDSTSVDDAVEPGGSSATAQVMTAATLSSFGHDVKTYGAVGDGVTDDSAAIQAAIDAAAGGGAVFFPTGVYQIGTATLTLPSDVTLMGMGWGSVIQATGAGRTDPFAHDILRNADQVNGNANITIRDLAIHGDRAHTSNQINGLDLEGGTANVRVINVLFEDHGVAIWIARSADTLIDGCCFLEKVANKSGIVVGAEGGNLSERVRIVNCAFLGTDEEAIDLNKGCRGILIEDNTFYRNHTSDDPDVAQNTEVIDVGSSDLNISDVVIQGNSFDLAGAARNGIWIKQKTTRVVIANNIIRDGRSDGDASAGVRISNCTAVQVVGNVIDNMRRGIKIEDAGGHTTPSEAIAIVGNTIRNMFRQAVWADGASTLGLLINDNVIDGAQTEANGIEVAKVTGLSVSGNNVSGFTGDGISIGATCSDVTVLGNVATGCNDGMTTRAGLVTISGNVCRDNSLMGIRCTGARSSIRDNNCSANGSTGILVAPGADRSIVSGNHCTGNDKGIVVAGVIANVIITHNIADGNATAAIEGLAYATGASITTGNIVA